MSDPFADFPADNELVDATATITCRPESPEFAPPPTLSLPSSSINTASTPSTAAATAAATTSDSPWSDDEAEFNPPSSPPLTSSKPRVDYDHPSGLPRLHVNLRASLPSHAIRGPTQSSTSSSHDIRVHQDQHQRLAQRSHVIAPNVSGGDVSSKTTTDSDSELYVSSLEKRLEAVRVQYRPSDHKTHTHTGINTRISMSMDTKSSNSHGQSSDDGFSSGIRAPDSILEPVIAMTEETLVGQGMMGSDDIDTDVITTADAKSSADITVEDAYGFSFRGGIDTTSTGITQRVYEFEPDSASSYSASDIDHDDAECSEKAGPARTSEYVGDDDSSDFDTDEAEHHEDELDFARPPHQQQQQQPPLNAQPLHDHDGEEDNTNGGVPAADTNYSSMD
jgi:hypothetical protein